MGGCLKANHFVLLKVRDTSVSDGIRSGILLPPVLIQTFSFKAENVPQHRKKSLVTVVASPATSLAIALSLARETTLVVVVVARETTPAAAAAKSAINVAKLGTLLAIALKAEAIAGGMVAVGMADASKLATLAVDMDTWREIALRARNATTVKSAPFFSALILVR